MSCLIFIWKKVQNKMIVEGKNFETACSEVQEEFLKDA